MTFARRSVDAASVALLVVTIALAVYGFETLGDRIPLQFHAGGVSYGPKWMLLVWPLVAAVLYAVFAYSLRLPIERMNLMVQVTSENRTRVAPVAFLMLSCVRLASMLVFSLLELVCIQSASGRISPIFPLLPIAAIGIVPMIIVFMLAIARAGQLPGGGGAQGSTRKL